MTQLKKVMVLLLIAVNIAACNTKKDKPNTIQIIPQPVKYTQHNGSWELSKKTTISYNNKEAQKVAQMLAEKINRPTGFSIKAEQSESGTINLNINSEPDTIIGNEGYKLISTKKGASITANTPAGLFYGMQTFLKILPKEIVSKTKVDATWLVQTVDITDYPRFAWRGIMLDVSRNFFSVEEVKAYIDEMVKAKFNTLHWHLTDDNGWRIEIKSLPKLTEIGAWRVKRYGQFGTRKEPQPGEPATEGGFYTQDEIKEIVEYAKERFVTIVPEIDVPGHSMAAIASYPYLCCTKNKNTKVNPGTEFAVWYDDGSFRMFIDNTLNPSDEKVYQFLDTVFTEVASLFPSEYIHAGGDECYMGYWEKDPGCKALMKKLNTNNPMKLHGYFMSRVQEILNKKGKKLIGWDEILEGGITKGAAVMNWQDEEKTIEAAHLGHKIVMTPKTYCYLDYVQGDPSIDPPIYASLRLKTCYDFNPVPEGIDKKYILGGQGNLWSEQVATLRHAQYMTYPRAWALAEDFWTPNENKNWEGFIERVENQFDRSDIAEVKYSKAIYDADIKITQKDGKKWTEIETEIPDIDIYYTIDGGIPDSFSPKYTNAFEIPEGPVTLRVITYRDKKPMGHLITLTPKMLAERAL